MGQLGSVRPAHARKTAARRFAEPAAGAASRKIARPGAPPVGITDERLAGIAILLLRSRHRLSNYFEPALFAAPAWDMLLELFVGQAEGRRMPTMDLCGAVRVPPATGLRWIQRLTDQRLVRRYKVPEDDRLALVRITPLGARLVRQYLFEGLARSDLAGPE
jgi:DNA-binding MarR family transcriptional regulator